MSKKEFNLDSYNNKKKKGNKNNKGNKKNKSNTSSKSNLNKPSNKTIRATFILNPETKEKIDAIAYYNRKEKSQQVEEILSSYIEENYTKKIREIWERSKKE